MNCLFCRIAAGSERAHLVVDEDDVIAFLDHRPLFAGHVLVMPRRHYETLGDLPAQVLERVFRTVQAMSLAVPEAMEAEGTFVAANNKVSQSVPHLHVHVVPRRKGDGLRGFFWPRTKYAGTQDMEEVAAAIRESLERFTK